MPWYGFTHHGAPDFPDTESSVETGSIFMYVGSDVPTGFLRCDGSNKLIATYQDLYDSFVAAGVSFGVAPLGQFKLPDFRNRFVAGLDPTDTGVDADPAIDLDTIGTTGGLATHSHTGSSTHTHSTPSHVHAGGSHDHSLATHTHTVPNHIHAIGGLEPAVTSPTDAFTNVRNASGTTLRKTSKMSHTHTLTGNVDTAGGTSTGPRDGANNASNSTVGSPSSSPTTSTTTTSGGTPSANNSAASTGGADSIPPYYSLYHIIKV